MAKARIALVSLGCAKNLVNSEQMLCLLDDAGYEITSELEGADAVVINTCGFIDSAKSEAIENILAAAELKKEGSLGKIIVTGCLSQRYRDELRTELPEVDAAVGTGSYKDIVEVVDSVLAGREADRFGDINAAVDETGRFITTGAGWAYIKIAEGCDNHCAYCTIPSIRGRFRSRPMENIVAEAKALAESGIKELIVIAQDITRYGLDLYGERKLHELVRKLSEIEGIEWIRLHYLYPNDITDELIDEIAGNDKICKYLDIPIQHINSSILKRMNRRGNGDYVRALFRKLRDKIPGVVLRTSLITGLPGEGEAEFEELCDFLREARIERVGVFPFSPEEGTPAAAMEDRVDEETASHRAELIMDAQQDILDEFNASRIGQVLKVMVDGSDGEYRTGRTEADSPDIDGMVYFEGDCPDGQFARVKITGIMDGDLYGEQV